MKILKLISGSLFVAALLVRRRRAVSDTFKVSDTRWAIVLGIVLHQPRLRRAWVFFLVGQLLFFLGDVYTYSYRILLHVSIPFPSFGDGVYLTMYPVLMAGLLLLVRRRNPGGGRGRRTDWASSTQLAADRGLRAVAAKRDLSVIT